MFAQGVLTIMAHKGRLHPKEVPLSGFRYMKGEGNLSFGSVKGLIGLTDESISFDDVTITLGPRENDHSLLTRTHSPRSSVVAARTAKILTLKNYFKK